MQRTVILPVSSIAAIIGRHAYKPRKEVFDEMWRKYSPATFTGKTTSEKAIKTMYISKELISTVQTMKIEELDKVVESIKSDPKLNDIQKEEVIVEVRSQVYVKTALTCKTDEEVIQVIKKDTALTPIQKEQVIVEVRSNMYVKSAHAVNKETSQDAAKAVNELTERIKKDPVLDDIRKAKVIEDIRSKISTNFGTRKEDKTAEKVQVEESSTFLRDDTYHKRLVCRLGNTEYLIVGKIDRIEIKPDGSKVLIEIKNRMNRLFMRLVDYEHIQIQTYLELLDLDNGKLIEQYNSTTNSINVQRDRDMWNDEILSELHNFCNEFHSTIFLAES